jgi:DNA repair protein RecO (recombination protein O)
MLVTTKAIVLHHFKYSEKSVIAKIYTEKFGLQSYILNGVRSTKAKNKAVYLQPLSLVEINANHKEKKGLQQLRSIKLDVPFSTIPFNITKTSLAFFISEVLYKTIKEEEPNVQLFNFLYNALQVLDLKDANYANFHLVFLGQLTHFIGITPQNKEVDSPNIYFDLQEGVFLSSRPHHKMFAPPEHSRQLITILNTSLNDNDLSLNYADRKVLLNLLLDYYNLHLSNFDNLKSLTVLEEVLN